MTLRSSVRPAPTEDVPLYPPHAARLRRSRYPVRVRGGPRRAPRGYCLPQADRRRVRANYHLRERKLAVALVRAATQPGDAADNLASQLERRLDALVHRAGFARTVREARRLIAHNTFTLDGGKVTRPSYLVRPGQVIQVRPGQRRCAKVVAATGGNANTDAPSYLEVRSDRFTATLLREPRREEVPGLRNVALTIRRENGARS